MPFCSMIRRKKSRRLKKAIGKTGVKSPAAPLGSGYNLHKVAGGSPKLCFTASNFRLRAGRPAIRRFKSASLIRNVGLTDL